jgi:quercetin dioxygenase-like cupin family protein
MSPATRACIDLQSEIDALIADGYRLDMIMPADDPREAIVSRNGEIVRLSQHPQSEIRNPKSKGRAGMEYRDLIPDRLDGRVIASHIRITKGGEVPDYVHYHKIRFQMIYCKRGWIRVVYEDQGPPFVLNAGDCVLQPPEIRHRVLDSSAGAEVIEVSAPAVHETWVEHELQLPTADFKPDRIFEGQRFVLHRADVTPSDILEGCRIIDTAIEAATQGYGGVRIVKLAAGGVYHRECFGDFLFLYVLSGNIQLKGSNLNFHADEHATFSLRDETFDIIALEDSEILEVSIREI